jgi:Flp pilus assembly pilin Flp
MTPLLRNFAIDEAAATSIEYALIASFVALAIFGVLASLGTSLNVPYKTVGDGLK